MRIPLPALTRLCALYRCLDRLAAAGTETVSSAELGRLLGVASHNIRKDISCLGDAGNAATGYVVESLKALLAGALSLDRPRRACIVGLGRLGSAILEYNGFAASGYSIVAGFDNNINRVESFRTSLPLFAASDIVEVCTRMGIELAAVAVPAAATQSVSERLVAGGVRGIVNFSTASIALDRDDVFVRNMDLVTEFTFLSARIALGGGGSENE